MVWGLFGNKKTTVEGKVESTSWNKKEVIASNIKDGLFESILEWEGLGECKTIEKAIENPLFFKGLATFIANYIKGLVEKKDPRVMEDSFRHSLLSEKWFIADHFLPRFFGIAPGMKPNHVRMPWSPDLQLLILWKEAFEDPNTLDILKRTFRLWNAEKSRNAYTNVKESIFREKGELSLDPLRAAFKAQCNKLGARNLVIGKDKLDWDTLEDDLSKYIEYKKYIN